MRKKAVFSTVSGPFTPTVKRDDVVQMGDEVGHVNGLTIEATWDGVITDVKSPAYINVGEMIAEINAEDNPTGKYALVAPNDGQFVASTGLQSGVAVQGGQLFGKLDNVDQLIEFGGVIDFINDDDFVGAFNIICVIDCSQAQTASPERP